MRKHQTVASSVVFVLSVGAVNVVRPSGLADGFQCLAGLAHHQPGTSPAAVDVDDPGPYSAGQGVRFARG